MSVKFQPKIQQITLNLTDDGTIQFTLSFRGVSTTTLTQTSWGSIVENALDALSTIAAIGSVEVEREKYNTYIQLTVTFVSNEATLEDIMVSTDTSHSSTIIQEPMSHATTEFTISLGSRTTESVNGTTSADDVENELYKLITTECSVSNEGNILIHDDYENSSPVRWGGSFDNFNEPYCGRFSIRNPRFIYRPVNGFSRYTVNSLQNRYVSSYTNVIYKCRYSFLWFLDPKFVGTIIANSPNNILLIIFFD